MSDVKRHVVIHAPAQSQSIAIKTPGRQTGAKPARWPPHAIDLRWFGLRTEPGVRADADASMTSVNHSVDALAACEAARYRKIMLWPCTMSCGSAGEEPDGTRKR